MQQPRPKRGLCAVCRAAACRVSLADRATVRWQVAARWRWQQCSAGRRKTICGTAAIDFQTSLSHGIMRAANGIQAHGFRSKRLAAGQQSNRLRPGRKA